MLSSGPTVTTLLHVIAALLIGFSCCVLGQSRPGDFEAISTDLACLGEVVRALLKTDPCMDASMGMGMDGLGTSLGYAFTNGTNSTVTTDVDVLMDQQRAARWAVLNEAANLGLANCGNTIRLKVRSHMLQQRAYACGMEHELDMI